MEQCCTCASFRTERPARARATALSPWEPPTWPRCGMCSPDFCSHTPALAFNEDAACYCNMTGAGEHESKEQDAVLAFEQRRPFLLNWHAIATQEAANSLNGYKMGEKTLVVKMAGSRGPPPGQGCALSLFHRMTIMSCLCHSIAA